jgi:hypothetical protein
MYRVECIGADRPEPSLHETASEALLAVYDLRAARTDAPTITDASGSTLTEVQLAMLALVERVQPQTVWYP